MRPLFLALLFPFVCSAQTELQQTHWAVFFERDIPVESRLQVLADCGVPSKGVEHFVTTPVSVVPVQEASAQLALNHAAIKHVAPFYMNHQGKFITYRSSFFVKLNMGQNPDEVHALAQRLGVRVLPPDPLMPNIIKLETSRTGVSPIDAVNAFKATGAFAIVSLNLMHTVADCSVDDPLFSRQWNLRNEGTSLQGNGTAGADMDVEAAWDITTGSPDIKIAILDSGVDTLHPDLLGKLMPGFDAMAEPDSAGTDGYPTPTYSQDGHGTACAGIAAASGNNSIGLAGVCLDCSIIPVRVFSYQDLGGSIQPFSNTESFIRGINWQWQVADADVSSNSWGVPDFLLAFFPGGDLLVNDAIDAATTQGRDGKGLPMLFSSGNDGVTDSIPIWPARYVNTVAVNASSMCDERKSPESCDGENWAGNWGNHLDCAAPGVRIPATDMLGSNGFNNTSYYNTFNGTSAACPNAAGVMGLLLSQYPDLSRANAERHLINGCEKVGGYAYDQWKQHGHWSDEMGYGRINAHHTLMSAATVGVGEVSAESPLVRTFGDRHEVLPNSASTVRWTLIDMNGRTVGQGVGTGPITVVHSGLATGVYAVRLSTDSGDSVVKIVVAEQE
jgi:subtilisin family serine protease